MKKLLAASLLVVAGLAGPAGPADAAVRGIDLACPPGEVPDDAFIDIARDDPHERAIDCAAFHHIAGGVDGSFYLPTSTVSRAQMATFMARLIDAAGNALPGGAPDAFDDDDGSPHEASINRLAAAGIVSGTGPGTYGPSGEVSRAQMATFLVRSYERASGVALAAGPDAFVDDDTSNHEANIDKAAAAGFAAGTSATTYDPGGGVRRNQMGSFVSRVLDRLAEDGLVEPADSTYVVDLDPSPEGAPPGFRIGTADIGQVRYEHAAVIPVQPGETITVRFDYGGQGFDGDSFSLGVISEHAGGTSIHWEVRVGTSVRSGSFRPGEQAYFARTGSTATFLELELSGAADAATSQFVLGDAVVGSHHVG